MIVCSCNIISSRDIEAVVERMLERDKWRLIVPSHIYEELGKAGKCFGCFPNVMETIVRVADRFHRARKTSEHELTDYLRRLRIHLNIHLQTVANYSRLNKAANRRRTQQQNALTA